MVRTGVFRDAITTRKYADTSARILPTAETVYAITVAILIPVSRILIKRLTYSTQVLHVASKSKRNRITGACWRQGETLIGSASESVIGSGTVSKITYRSGATSPRMSTSFLAASRKTSTSASLFTRPTPTRPFRIPRVTVPGDPSRPVWRVRRKEADSGEYKLSDIIEGNGQVGGRRLKKEG